MSKAKGKRGKKGNPEELQALEEKEMFYAKYMSIKSRLGKHHFTKKFKKFNFSNFQESKRIERI